MELGAAHCATPPSLGVESWRAAHPTPADCHQSRAWAKLDACLRRCQLAVVAVVRPAAGPQGLLSAAARDARPAGVSARCPCVSHAALEAAWRLQRPRRSGLGRAPHGQLSADSPGRGGPAPLPAPAAGEPAVDAQAPSPTRSSPVCLRSAGCEAAPAGAAASSALGGRPRAVRVWLDAGDTELAQDTEAAAPVPSTSRARSHWPLRPGEAPAACILQVRTPGSRRLAPDLSPHIGAEKRARGLGAGEESPDEAWAVATPHWQFWETQISSAQTAHRRSVGQHTHVLSEPLRFGVTRYVAINKQTLKGVLSLAPTNRVFKKTQP